MVCRPPADIEVWAAKPICLAPAGGVNTNVDFASCGLVFQFEKLARNCG
jgi:hypothetical protein